MDSKNIVRNLAVVPVPVLIALILFFGILHPSAKVIEPPYLFPILNTVFLFLVSCVVAYVAMRSYLASGSATILLLGAGVLVFGTGSFASGWTIVQWGVNVSATVHNAPLLLAAIFHICGVIASAKEQPPETDPVHRRWKLFAAYTTAPVFVFSVFLLSVEGIMPAFFVAGVGTTALRQAVLASAFVLLVYSSAYMLTRFLWKKEPYLYWYSLALALLAVMSGGFYIQPAIGSPVGWVGRGAQYLAGVYFIASVISAKREAQKRGASLNESVAELFLSPGFHWQDILKTALNGFSIVDTKGRFLEVNEACSRMLGYTRQELLSMTIADVEAVESPSDVLRRIDALKEKKTDHFVTKNRRKDGSIIDVEVNATYLNIGKGQVATFFQDITERQRAEEEVHMSYERLRTFFDRRIGGIGIVIAKAEGGILEANDYYLEILGCSRDELLAGKVQWLEMTPPEWLPADERALKQLRERGACDPYEKEYVRRDGSRIPVLITDVMMPGEGGEILAIVVNMTERKRAEDALRAAKNELEERVKERTYELYAESLYARSLIEASLDPLVTISVDGKITDVNHASEEVTGVPREQLIGSDFSNYFTEPEKARTGYEQVFRKGFVRDYPLELKRRDGHVTPVVYNASVYRDDTGQIMGVFAAARDITERKQAESVLRKLASELAMAEERERKRIAGVLHDDIAQTLATVRMRLDLLQGITADRSEQQTLKEAKTLLSQSLQETRALMNDLGNPVLFDVGPKAACEALANQMMKRHAVRISCDIQDTFKDLNPDVKTILFQAVKELLNNVAKHSRAHNAQVMIDMEDKHLRVKVTDDGVGFDPRVLGTPTAEGGFGLYNIRERLLAIGGSLGIESIPGTGTVVSATLPAELD